MELLPLWIQDEVVPVVGVDVHDVVVPNDSGNLVRLEHGHDADDGLQGQAAGGGHLGGLGRSRAQRAVCVDGLAVHALRVGHQMLVGEHVVGLGQLTGQHTLTLAEEIVEAGGEQLVGEDHPVAVLRHGDLKGLQSHLGGVGGQALGQLLGVLGVCSADLEHLDLLALAQSDVDLLAILVEDKLRLGLADELGVHRVLLVGGQPLAGGGVHVAGGVLGNDNVREDLQIKHHQELEIGSYVDIHFLSFLRRFVWFSDCSRRAIFRALHRSCD